ncbi:MAG TPA: SMP-30/gluconolactonase/LRE family protein [Devosiaceae bacterium]|jgi:sugar lactone lactonase YvrE
MTKQFRPSHGLAIGLFACLAATGAYAAGPDKVQIGDAPNVFPESMSGISDGTLYAGSSQLGVVYKAAPGAAKADSWIPAPADGPQAILGVYADEKAKTLWVCYSDFKSRRGTGGLPAIVRSYDLATAAVTGTYPMLDGSFCNDITTAADGTPYAADTSGGRIMRLKPGATALDVYYHDDKLVGIDGIAMSPDGKLFVNNVDKSQLFRVDMAADGSASGITEIQTSAPLKGPDGMRFGDDGKLYVAENKASQVDALTIDGDKADVKVIKSGFQTSTGVTKLGNTLWVSEAKFGQKDPGAFYMYAVPLN